MLVLDAGAVTRLAARPGSASHVVEHLRRNQVDRPLVPTPVLMECLTSHGPRDARVNQLLKTCEIVEVIEESTARRAAYLRTRARQGSAVDALVIALAEPNGRVLTGDVADLRALATYAAGVVVEAV